MEVSLPIDAAVLAGGALLLLGIVGAASASRLRVPAVIVVLVLGMAIGDDGLDLVSFADVELAQSIAVAALVAILFDGGLGTTASRLRTVALPAGLLATVGVAGTAGAVALVAAPLLDVPATTAMLCGAILASTDAAAVFSVLRGVRVPARVRTLLEAESGFNDPVAVLLVVGLLESIRVDVGVVDWLVFGGRQLGGGAVVGVAVGVAGAWLLRRIALATGALAPIVGLGTAALAYGAAAAAGSSGFLATYVAGVTVSTLAPTWRRPMRRFHETSATTAEIALFLLLGLLVFPGRLGDVALDALVVTAAIVLVARPLVVAAILVPLRWRLADVVVVSWAGLRGAVPMVFATFPLTAGHPAGELLFEVAFVVVLVATAVQGGTVAALAARARSDDDDDDEASLAEVVPVDVAGVDVVEIVLAAGSQAAHRPLREIPLPKGVRVGVVGRAGTTMVPGGDTELLPGDRVVVMGVGLPDLPSVVEAWAGSRRGSASTGLR